MTVPTPTTTIPDRPGEDLADLFAALDLAVFEQTPSGLFRPIGHLPPWLPLTPDSDGTLDLADQFPLLEVFFPECEPVWEAGQPAQIRSDIWSEPAPGGGELYLEAVASLTRGRRFLALRSLPQALFTYQQLAHDFELEKEKVERLSREVELRRQEAERATQAKSTFLATMSHEIRTPLNSIIGMADVLSATSLSPEQRKCVDVFQRNGVGLLNLINDILDLSKVEAGHLELEQTDLDLLDVVARAMEVVEIRVKAKGLWLRQVVDPAVPVRLIGDPNRLRQILINLLGNSIKFTEKGGLEIRVQPDPDDPTPGSLRFGITDTGIGIPKDKLGLLFQSFSQADSSTTRKYGGTGLGLSISKQLVELMGGRIWVESEPGVGSTFFFTAKFKVQENQAARPSAPQAATSSLADLEARAAGLRILLADDSDDNRFLILSYLKRTQSKIEIAENGEIAVQKFKAEPWDIVLMDVEMPVLDGYGATRAIRSYEAATGASPTPVIALTAHAFADMATAGAEAGFTCVLTKPIRAATLLEALARYRGNAAPRAPMPEQAPAKQEAPPAAGIKVLVEEGMEDVVPGYLEKRRAEVAAYNGALETGDFDTIRKLAHKMKGTGTGYGFPKLTEFGTVLEKAAIAQDAAQIRGTLGEFTQYVEMVELEFIKH